MNAISPAARRNAGRLGQSSLLALAIALPAMAHAQTHAQTTDVPAATTLASNDAQANSDDIVVTARKRAERLRDVPTAGTALSADTIRDLGGVPTAQSLLTNSPGVNFANTSAPVTSEISIRGSGTSRATNASAGVGLYRDGAYIGGGTVGGRSFTELDLFDIERVEVLRGVQGGLEGRNAEGGAINVVSVRPSDRFEGFVQAMAGSPGVYELQLAAGAPLNDHWAVRLSGDIQRQDHGFYRLYLLDDYADIRNKNFVRGQIRYKDSKFTANFLAEHGYERLPGLTYQANNFPSATYPTGLTQDRFNMPWNYPSRGTQEVNSFELTTSYDFGFAELATTSMYRERSGLNSYDRDATSLEFIQDAIAAGKVAPSAIGTVLAGDYGLGGRQSDLAHIFFQDVHLTGAKIGGFEWTLGAEWYRLRDKPRNVLGKTPTTASPSPGTVDVGSQHLDSYAAYGSLGYDITSRLNLSGDVRVTRDEEEVHSARLDLATGLPAGVGFNVDGSRRATNASYTVTLSYKPFLDTLIYGKIGSAYRAGGFNTALGDPRQPIPVPPTFDNETVTAYEIGFKGNLTHNLYVTAAAYKNDFDNLVVQGDNGCAVGITACPVQATIFAFNAGPAKLWGVEGEITGRADILGGPLRVSVGGSRQGGHITGGIYDGRRQPQQPDWTMTFNVNYRHPLVDGWTGFLNMKGSGRWGGVQEIGQVPPLYDYVIFDGRIGVEKGPIEIALFSENLGNESYIVFRSTNANADIRRFNMPRTWGVQLRYTW